ncbi:MAG: NUDIX hydrolase [Dehalococcoidia bacterium]
MSESIPSASVRNLPKVELGAGGYVVDPEGRLLLIDQQRGDVRHWGSIGGGLEYGESIEECAVREIFEESGLRVRIERLVAVFEMYRSDQLFAVGFTFLTRPDGWPQECALPERDGITTFHGHGWFTRDEAASLSIFPADMALKVWPSDVQTPLLLRLDD